MANRILIVEDEEKLARLVAQRQAVLHHVDVDAKQLIDTRVNAALVQHGFELAF